MSDEQHLVRQLVHNGADALIALTASAAASDDVTLLVAAAVVTPGRGVLLAQAAAAAATTHQRQLVAIAAAYLDGDTDRVDALARDHLADHPSGVLVAWISALSKSPNPLRKDPS
jgi:hypothetical protein